MTRLPYAATLSRNARTKIAELDELVGALERLLDHPKPDDPTGGTAAILQALDRGNLTDLELALLESLATAARLAIDVADPSLAHVSIADVLNDVAEIRAIDELIGLDRRGAYSLVYSAFRALVATGAVEVEPIGEGLRPESRTYALAPGDALVGPGSGS